MIKYVINEWQHSGGNTANDTGGHFIFDYDGNVLVDLSEYHDWLKTKEHPLDILLTDRGF